MLRSLTLHDLAGGINVVDIGASGRLDRKWKPLENWINLVGFEPNAEECARLSAVPHNYHSARYFPYAIGASSERATLYKTQSLFCSSLLEPKHDWLRRLSFGHLFEVVGTEQVEVRALLDINELHDLDADVIKIDTQGMELPILANSGHWLDRAFYVETETGFVESYRGETTYAEMDQFMRARGFLLFDINTRHRVARRGPFAQSPSGKEQILWCEAVWLKDYVALASVGGLRDLSRDKVLKVLLLCALEECYDFGYELAALFASQGLIAESELHALSSKKGWYLSTGFSVQRVGGSLAGLLRLLPKRARRCVVRKLEKTLDQPDLLKAILGKRASKRAA